MVLPHVENVARQALALTKHEDVHIRCTHVATINGYDVYSCLGDRVWPPIKESVAEHEGKADHINESFETVQQFLLQARPELDTDRFVEFFDQYLCPFEVRVVFESDFPGWHKPRMEGYSLVFFCADLRQTDYSKADDPHYTKIAISPDYVLHEHPLTDVPFWRHFR